MRERPRAKHTTIRKEGVVDVGGGGAETCRAAKRNEEKTDDEQTKKSSLRRTSLPHRADAARPRGRRRKNELRCVLLRGGAGHVVGGHKSFCRVRRVGGMSVNSYRCSYYELLLLV